MLRRLMLLGTLFASAAAAEEPCRAQAVQQQLVRTDLQRFMARCEKAAGARCDALVRTQNLTGGMRNAVSAKCLREAVGH